MIECPYCYSAVKPQDATCPNCSKPIERWQTGFYSRQALPKKGRSAVLAGAALLCLLMLAGFAKSCHWI